MRIVVLSNCPLVESQGSGYVILGYARELRARGHDVDCVGPESCEFLPRLRAARVWRLSLGIALFVLRDRRPWRADLVELYGGETWLAVLLLRLLRTRAVLVHHSNGLETRVSEELVARMGSDTHSGQPRRWYQWRGHALLKQAFTRVDAVVTVSALEHAYARQRRYQPDERLLTLDTALPAPFLGLPAPGARPAVVGYCGGWFARKGVEVMRQAFTALLRARPQLVVRLAGVGPGFRVADEFPADVAGRVEVTPFIADKDVLRAWYTGLAVFMMPSCAESFGLVVSEAMACGCAVVASRTGFAAGLADGEEALVLDTSDAAAYAGAVARLLDDDALRLRVARRGHERVQALRWDDAGERLDRFYRALRPAPAPRARLAGQR